MNGPEPASVLTVTSVKSLHPPAAEELSLTDKRKFIVLLTVGTTSQVGVTPAAKSVKFGK